MPVKLYSGTNPNDKVEVPATNRDKALLIRANTHPPGVRGMLRIPTDPVYKVFILFFNLFTFGFVLFDFTQNLSRATYAERPMPMEEGLFRHLIFCFDFIFVIDVLLSICHRKAKMTPARSIIIITIDIISLMPSEIIYVVLKGTHKGVYFSLRLRYMLRLLRYIPEVRRHNSYKLSLAYGMSVYMIVMSGLCLLCSCVRLTIHCSSGSAIDKESSIIECENLTAVDFLFTYAIVNGQVSYSGILFVNDPYGKVNYMDSMVQMFVQFLSFILIPKMISILLENNQHKYTFCLSGNYVLKAVDEKRRGIRGMFRHGDDQIVYLRKYMASYWRHNRIENVQTSYVGNYKAATIPSVIYSEITLDLTWNMFKHSILFKHESVAFLRLLSKLTVFSFGSKNDIIYEQGKFRSIMVYIIKGIVCLMNETTGTKQLMSFSGGTVFGELSLFLNVPSSTTIFCSTYCEYLVLSRINFQEITKVYPLAYRRLRAKCLKRVDYARNYDFIAKEMYANGDIKLPKSKVSLRYIKAVLRTYMKTPAPPLTQSIFIPSHMTPEASFGSTIFNARFIPLYVEANKIESSFTTHFSVSGLNFKLKEGSTLYKIWRYGISLLTLIDCLFFPLGAAQDIDLFTNFYDYFVVGINTFYILDFISYNFIAVKHRGRVIVNSEAILLHKIQKIDFWLDLIGCIPIEKILNLMQTPLHPYHYRLIGINRLIKLCRVLWIINNHLTFSSIILIIMPIVKSIYAIVLLLFFGYLVFHRFGYFALCNIDVDIEEMSFWMKILIVYQFFFSMGEVGMEVKRDITLMPMILLQKIGIIIFTHILCLNAASFSLIYEQNVQYENLIDDIKRTFVLFQFPYGPRKKMAKFMKLLYDTKSSVDDNVYHRMMGKSFYNNHCIKLHYPFISKLRLFESMPKPILNNLCEIAEILFFPQGELVVNAGSIVTQVYFIMDGRCEYSLKSGLGALKPLTSGDAIALFEAFLGLNALTNVIAITDCRLLSFSVSDLRRKLVKFPEVMQTIMDVLNEVITKRQLGQLQTIEARVTAMREERESCRYFGPYKAQFKKVFGFWRVCSLFFMRQSITSFGRFWFWWEFSHISVTLLYTFFGCIPITVTCSFTDYWFWFFRLMDAFYLVDIYLQHHVIYFNENQIEVQHPWMCAKHYWKTSFFLDLIATIPLELIVLPHFENIEVIYLIMLRMNRYLRLLRYRGIHKYLNFQYLKVFKLEIFLVCLSLSLLFYNFLAILLFEGEIIDVRHCLPVFNNENAFSFWSIYVTHLHVALKQLCNIGIHESFARPSALWIYVPMNAFGQIIITTLSCVIIAMSLFRRMYLMTFQIKMQRLVMFMNQRKIDKFLRNEIIKHYEYLWTLREGKVMKDTLQAFNINLTEDVIYSYYAPTFQNSLLFMDCPKVLLKDLLSSQTAKREMFLITGVVIRVNDVHDKIYIVFRGKVQVLGPDYSYLRDLHIGSIFGCLDNVHLHRSTLTYVAKTHCELISLQSLRFHDIVRKYPMYYRHYTNMLKMSNFDYVPTSSAEDEMDDDYQDPRERSTVPSTDSETTKINPRWIKVKHIFNTLFPIMKEREYVKIIFVVYLLIAFQFECMLITFLYGYFSYVVLIAYGMDIIFLIKIYIDFSTEYEDQYGIKIQNRRLIAERYSSQFFGVFFHIIAIIPIEIFVFGVPTSLHNRWWAYLRCNRLLRIVLVFRYIRSVRNRLNINVRLIKSLDALLILYTTQQISTIFMAHYFHEYEYLGPFVFHSYFISKRVFTPKKSSLIPHLTKIVLAYKLAYILVLLATQMIYVLVIGDCVATYQMLNFSSLRYETFLNDQEAVMRIMSVSPPLFNRVRRYCRNLIHHGLNVQFPGFLIDAPYYLREGVLDAMFGFHLRAHPVFKLCHMDFNRQVAATFKTLYFFEGDFIAFQGDIDTKMYFIHVGEVEGLIEDNIYYDVADSKYFAGDYFGYHQLIYENVGHTKTYKVVSKTAMVITVKRWKVMQLLEFYPASKFLFYSQDTANDDLDIAPVVYRDYLKYTKEIHD